MKFSQLLLLSVITYLVPNLMIGQVSNVQKNVHNKLHSKSFNKYLPGAVVDSGYFNSKQENERICFELMDQVNRKKQHYIIENCFALSEVNVTSESEISIVRSSGALMLNKNAGNSGDFTFVKNPEFVEFLKDEGIALDNDLYYFKIFLGDLDKSYILDIKKLDYQPTITELGRLVWHDTSIRYIQEMNELIPNVDLGEISILSAKNISVAKVQEIIDAGVEHIDFHTIKRMANQFN